MHAIVSQNGSGQPTIQFVKVSNANPQPQPTVMQYCVNSTAGGSNIGQVRVQSPAIAQIPTAAQQQQGMVLLQLAGGRTIPVSLAPGNSPVARMGSRPVAPGDLGQGPRIRQLPPTGVLGNPQLVARTVVQNPSPIPQPTRISAPISRFQNPNIAHATQNIRAPVPQNLNSQSPVARARIARPSNTPPRENNVSSPVPPPFWNQNLVIRTRRASTQETTNSGDGNTQENYIQQGATSYIITKGGQPVAQLSNSNDPVINLVKSGDVTNVLCKFL